MRVLVCGSRWYGYRNKGNLDIAVPSTKEREHIYSVLDEYLTPELRLISGGASGVDSCADHYAKWKKVPIYIFPANWDKYGKGAGPVRNKQMLDEGKPDLVVAFLAKDSRGTKNMIEQAEKVGVPVKVINI